MPHQVEGQVLVFHFEEEDDLLPERYSAAIIPDLKRLSQQGPIGLLATFGPNARAVSPKVISFWLDRARDPQIRIQSIAVVTNRLALRIAVQAFTKAARMFRADLQAQHFATLPEAKAWLGTQLGAPGAAPAQ